MKFVASCAFAAGLVACPAAALSVAIDVISIAPAASVAVAADPSLLSVEHGVAHFNVTDSIPGKRAEVFGGAGAAGFYSSVQRDAVLDYELAGESFSFIWGSPDPWNLLSFLDDDGAAIGSIDGRELIRIANRDGAWLRGGRGAVHATFTPSRAFSSIRFESPRQNAFEFAFAAQPDVRAAAAVPLPASAVLLSAALGGLAVASRRRR